MIDRILLLFIGVFAAVVFAAEHGSAFLDTSCKTHGVQIACLVAELRAINQ
jgi:hypothetical protein